MSDKAFWESSVVPAREIEAAGDAIRMLFEQSDREKRGGVHYYYLAQVALEAAFEERLATTLLHARGMAEGKR